MSVVYQMRELSAASEVESIDRSPASDTEIDDVAQKLGVVFDQEYRSLLTASNGWPSLAGFVFHGTEDYLERPLTASDLADPLSPLAHEFFSSAGIDDPTLDLAEGSSEVRFVVIAEGRDLARYIGLLFSITAEHESSVLYDCMGGGENRYSSLSEWLQELVDFETGKITWEGPE